MQGVRKIFIFFNRLFFFTLAVIQNSVISFYDYFSTVERF